jgi:protein-tyrosine phosphatase
MKAHVLFVCLGNICRSPMAEAVLRQLVEEAGLAQQIIVDSAGTGDWHIGQQPHKGTRQILDQHHISYAGMNARLITHDDFAAFQYIVCMDESNLSNVRKLLQKEDNVPPSQLFTFMELLPDRGVANVPDPYFDGNFPYVYELVDAGCRVLLERIKTDLQL